MFYTVYKITNIINDKIYIGKHQTKNINDGYFGSGTYLKKSIIKHGPENFIKEIIHIFDNEGEMNAKEKELVSLEFCLREDTYNIAVGGLGGFGFRTAEQRIESGSKGQRIFKEKYGPEFLQIIGKKGRDKIQQLLKDDPDFMKKFNKRSFLNKHHTEESKLKIGQANSVHQKGSKNSQFGKMWITDGVDSKKIKNTDNIPEGWYKGRKLFKVR